MGHITAFDESVSNNLANDDYQCSLERNHPPLLYPNICYQLHPLSQPWPTWSQSRTRGQYEGLSVQGDACNWQEAPMERAPEILARQHICERTDEALFCSRKHVIRCNIESATSGTQSRMCHSKHLSIWELSAGSPKDPFWVVSRNAMFLYIPLPNVSLGPAGWRWGYMEKRQVHIATYR